MAVYLAEAPPNAATLKDRPQRAGVYAWTVFALTFGLLLSDYMSRQVLNAVFPVLKAEWALSDTQLGSLSSIVALLVGLLTFPLSVVADRWGRVKSIVLMAALWSLATLACALSTTYEQMFAARFFVGVGEAAYGSVGIALILSIFPASLRSTLTGAFMAGGAVGSVLGMAGGGIVATYFGWRWSFAAMAIFGLLLVALYRLLVTEGRLAARAAILGQNTGNGSGNKYGSGPITNHVNLRVLGRALFASTSVKMAYLGSGLQLFIMASMIAWMPSFLNRYYGMAADRAGVVAGLFILIGAVGMVVCGIITDRLSRNAPERKWVIAMSYSLISATLLGLAFMLPPGMPQLVLIGAGMLLVAGTSGPAGAMVANLTPPAIHASAFATLTLGNNLLGLAPGPFFTGLVADYVGLQASLQIVPLTALGAAAAFAVGRRTYTADLACLKAIKSR